MGILKKLFRHFVYGNFLIALSCTAFSLFFFEAMELENFKSEISLFIFSASLFIYNFQRKIGFLLFGKFTNANYEQWFKQNKNFTDILILISFCSSFYFFSSLPKHISWLLFPLGFLCVAYVLKIKQRIPTLRELPYVKTFVIAFVWGGIVVFLPLIANFGLDAFFIAKHQLIALSVGLFILGITLPFDIRDSVEDLKSEIKTIPNQLGIKQTKNISLLALILSVSSLYFCNVSLTFFLAFSFATIYAIAFVLFSNENRNDFYFSFYLEFSCLLPWIVFTFTKTI